MAGEQRHACGTENPHRIDTMVLIKAAVLGGNKGFHHDGGDLIQGQRDTALLTVLGDKFAIRAVDLHWDLEPDITKRSDIRQLRLNIFVQTKNRACSKQNATDCKDQ